MASISFKPMTENDLLLLHSWFQKPHVKRWYARGENYTLDEIKDKYLPRILNPAVIPNFIVYADDTPIGYIQLYSLKHSLPEGVLDYTHPLFDNNKPDYIAGVDLFIADENYLRKGYGTLILKNFISEHVKDKFTALIVDPLKSNQQAICFFERCGFKKLIFDNVDSANEILIYHVG